MRSTTTPQTEFIGECLGTFLLVVFGCGVVASAVTTGAQVGIFQVAIIWGIGIATAIYLTGSLSGAHLNPAVTLALVATKEFPVAKVPRYLVAQFIGAFGAAGLLYMLYGGTIAAFEGAQGIVRGLPGSEASAMIFGEFFPNPGGRPLPAGGTTVSHGRAFLVEFIGTAILLLVIRSITDERNSARPQGLIPLTIGLTVTILISLFGPLTMAGFNPARDLAPRIFSSLAGWGSTPFSANGIGWLTVYVVAPLLGGVFGSVAYSRLLRPRYRDCLWGADKEQARRLTTANDSGMSVNRAAETYPLDQTREATLARPLARRGNGAPLPDSQNTAS